MQCENIIPSVGAYFFEAKIKNVRCDGIAKWVVTVNPPSKENDGKVRLCDHCNKFDYLTFPRKTI